MQCGDCSCDQTIKTYPSPSNTVTLIAAESTKLPKNAKVVLVTAAAVEITLPYQPAPGTQITVATRSTTTTVKPGCAPTACGCSSDAEPECDTLCNAEVSVALAQCTQAIFTYFPPDPCDSAVLGTWVYETVEPAPASP